MSSPVNIKCSAPKDQPPAAMGRSQPAAMYSETDTNSGSPVTQSAQLDNQHGILSGNRRKKGKDAVIHGIGMLENQQ